MSRRATLATAARVLRQLRRDKRTVALLTVVPSLLLVLLYFAFDSQRQSFDRVAPSLVGLIPFITMFIITSIAMLRERTSGTLERLMSMPMAKVDLMAGYAIAFGLAAAAEVVFASVVVFGVLDTPVAHSTVALVGVAVIATELGMVAGLFVSAFATTEFQAVQFMPAFVLPQLLICGLFVDRSHMAGWLEGISWAMPLTYVYDGLFQLARPGDLSGLFWWDLVVIIAVAAASLLLGAATLRRRTI